MTGAGGFIGRHVCALLARAGYRVRGAGRLPSPATEIGGLNEWIRVGSLGADADWSVALDGVEAVVHLAGRAHVLRDKVADPLAEHRRVNVAGTEALAEQAAQRGVRRFVFMSSIKVNGERTGRLADGSWQRYTEDDAPSPVDPYGVSKWEAEQTLTRVAKKTGLEVVVLRPPLVYGPGVGANFLRLMRLVDRGWPLPFARVDNLRSLIYVENLADAVLCCLQSEAAAGRTYLVSDADVSTPDLVIAIGRALGRKARLVGLPPVLLRLGGYLALRGAVAARLIESLAVDDTLIRRELFWSPPCTMKEGLARTVAWFRQNR